ncbi:LuxR C-terminal-related transcriptional regulator [Streptomyces sp. NPDC048288]|uniref:LuxR C-terminal-related transcriptional regulator n=1 Tax=Streptomyces sp. NPDC048288 TaxID=3365529 RepID=UPI0037108084
MTTHPSLADLGLGHLEEVLADIGDRVRAERKAIGLSEAALADLTGLDRATVRRVQDGVGSLRTFLRVCTGLRVDMDYLLSDRWRMPESGLSLTSSQARVLAAVEAGEPIAVVAARLGMSPQAVGSHLTRIYQRLGVTHLPVAERRSAAVRVAARHGLLTTKKRTS